MKKKNEIRYTAPLTGVEEFSQDMSVASVHDALQTTWETKSNSHEQKNCEQAKDK